MTSALLAFLTRLEHRPEVLVSGSAIGFYGIEDCGAIDESVGQGRGFAAELCARWEAAARQGEALGIRTILLRTGIVLGNSGGMLASLLPIFEAGLGGPVGHGRQVMSWIHRDDLVRLIVAAVADVEIDGVLNATAPNPVSSRAFAAALGQALRRPANLPLPSAPLRLALGDLAEELLLGGQKVLPVKAVFHGFRFRYPRIEQALGDLVGHPAAHIPTPTRPFVEARLLH
ncbi:TIGR01777 family oxidoreductase [Sphingomonas sp. So64.6b]|uniref:TIGR01777 family oxidoreductase n=1 Tax=Sphingomonas sp. So64.6b TaxID=2997354 RepID=UPI001FCE69E8|nr:TIGR01777 family oxidoreductase [Sphingomonas sp. So64.6b]